LRECHGQILIATGEAAQISIATVANDTFPELLNWRMRDHLDLFTTKTIIPSLPKAIHFAPGS